MTALEGTLHRPNRFFFFSIELANQLFIRFLFLMIMLLLVLGRLVDAMQIGVFVIFLLLNHLTLLRIFLYYVTLDILEAINRRLVQPARSVVILSLTLSIDPNCISAGGF